MFFSTLFINCNNKATHNIDDSLKGHISISGAFALYPMASKWAEEYTKLYPNIKIDISAGGAGKGITDVLSGMVDIAMVSRDISAEEIDKGAWFIAVAKDAVLPTINSKNPYIKEIKEKGLTKDVFKDIFVTGKIKDWAKAINIQKSSYNINVFTRSDACGAAETWARYMGVKQENLKGVGVYGDPGMAKAVKNEKLGIGYNNVIYLYDIQTHKPVEGIDVIPIDINKNGQIDENENFYSVLDSISAAIIDGRYPSPPSRELFFVLKGKPQKPHIKAFLRWILTEGQKYIKEAGYVSIAQPKIKEELKRLN